MHTTLFLQDKEINGTPLVAYIVFVWWKCIAGWQEEHMHGSWALFGEKICNSSKYVHGGWEGSSIDAPDVETIEETQTHPQSLSGSGHIWISENFSFSGGNAHKERMGGGCKEDEEAKERQWGRGWSKKRRQEMGKLKGRAKGQRVRREHIFEENGMHVSLFFSQLLHLCSRCLEHFLSLLVPLPFPKDLSVDWVQFFLVGIL